MLKYDCVSKGYYIYFATTKDAAEYFDISIKELNQKLHFKKGYVNTNREKTLFDRIYRVENKPLDTKFNKEYIKEYEVY
jgi:hypothetical protein